MLYTSRRAASSSHLNLSVRSILAGKIWRVLGLLWLYVDWRVQWYWFRCISFCSNLAIVFPRRWDLCVEISHEFSMWKQTLKHKQTLESHLLDPNLPWCSLMLIWRVPLVGTFELSWWLLLGPAGFPSPCTMPVTADVCCRAACQVSSGRELVSWDAKRP